MKSRVMRIFLVVFMVMACGGFWGFSQAEAKDVWVYTVPNSEFGAGYEVYELLQCSVPFGVPAIADSTEIFNEILFLDTLVQETVFLIMYRDYPLGENRLCELVNVFVVVLFHLHLRFRSYVQHPGSSSSYKSLQGIRNVSSPG